MDFAKRLLLPTFLGAILISLFVFSLSFANEPTLPAADAEATTAFPTGVDAFKITVQEEGIYEISKSELVAAGFPAGANLTDYVLTNRGEVVAYQYISAGEKIRFFADSFSGSWEEKLYVDHEIFWLWPGTAALISDPGSPVTGAAAVTTHRATVKHEYDDLYSSTKIEQATWDAEGLDPDSMYWTELVRSGGSTVTTSLAITLPGQTAGNDAQFRFMVAVEGKGTSATGDGNASIQVNSYNQTVSQYIIGPYGAAGTPYLLDQTVPASELAINNTVVFTHSPGAFSASNILLINYVEVDYDSDLTANNDQIIFTHPGSGSFDFQIDGFSTVDPAQIIAWDITDVNNPVAKAPRTPNGGTHQIGVNNQSGDARYAVAAEAGLKTASTITRYNGPSLTPAAGSAAWIAITHVDFTAAANSLAGHRATFSNLTTHVVDVNDIFNQFGYGYPTPQAIKAYLQHAYDNWPSQPGYVTLIGTSNLNPRQLACTQCNEAQGDWQTAYESYIPFNYAFTDRFLGLVPSDHDYSLLDGNDILPDIAIGRLGVSSAAEAQDVVNKIIASENGLQTSRAWHNDVLFVHDYNKNSGDNFIGDINSTLPHLPNDFDTNIIGMNTAGDAGAVLTQLNAAVNSGVAVLNYRGHGSIENWSGGSFVTSDKVNSGVLFNNIDKPHVSISLDCLDGHFGYPGVESLSIALLKQDNRGSTAHWSSTGLGFAYEHNILAEHFYTALFDNGYTAIGDAINQAKITYETLGYDDSEVYSFLLQGDPAMQVFLPELAFGYNTSPSRIKGGENGTISLVATNSSSFAASNQATISYTLPISLNLNSVSGNGISYSTTTNGAGQTVVTVVLGNGIPANGQLAVEFDVTPVIDTPTVTVSSPADFKSPGFNSSQTVLVNLRNLNESDVFIPFVTR